MGNHKRETKIKVDVGSSTPKTFCEREWGFKSKDKYHRRSGSGQQSKISPEVRREEDDEIRAGITHLSVSEMQAIPDSSGEKTFGDTEGVTRKVHAISRLSGSKKVEITEARKQAIMRAWSIKVNTAEDPILYSKCMRRSMQRNMKRSEMKCDVCGKSDKHPLGFFCPYLISCPKRATVGRGYGVICKICRLPAGHHPDSNFWAGRAQIMICSRCDTRGQHWSEDCPSPKREINSWSDRDWRRSLCIPIKD